MASFVRQLNMYDFHKSRNDTYEHVFKHPLFIRGHEHDLKNITRKTPEYQLLEDRLEKQESSFFLQKIHQLLKN